MYVLIRNSIKRNFEWVVFAIIFTAAALRVGFWLIHIPPSKVYFIFNPQVVETTSYLLSFESSHPIRMPYYDVIANWFYIAFEGLLGIRAIGLFALLVSIVSLPFFYIGVRNIFNRPIALLALCFLSFYPKLFILTAEAMPEVASASFAAMSLYPISKTIENQELSMSVIAGATATLAFLMFDPALPFLGLTVLFLYAERAGSLLDWEALDRVQVAYTLPGAVTVILYVIFGPVATALQVGSGGNDGLGTGTRELFMHPETLTLPTKVIRFLAYTHFDFWWHSRGFDTEVLIMNLLNNIAQFMQPFFTLFLTGWAAITLLLTIFVIAGVVSTCKRRTVAEMFVLVWFVGYCVLFLGTNLGWQGAFQTRHVLPILPAIAVLFGIGTDRVTNFFYNRLTIQHIRARVPVRLQSKLLISIGIVCLLFSILLLTATAQVVLVSDNHAERNIQPVEQLNTIVGDGEQVAVVGNNNSVYQTNLREVVLYSGGRLRPTVLATNKRQAENMREQTVGIDVREGSPVDLVSNLNETTYLFFLSRCSDLDPMQRSFIEAALNHGGNIVHKSSTISGETSQCEVNTVIIQLDK